MAKRSTAFTLGELIIVVVIIAVLAAIAIPNFLEGSYRTDVTYRQNDMRTIALAMESYRIERGDYPASDKDSPLAGHGTRDDIDQRLLTTPTAYMPEILTDGFRKKADKKERRDGSPNYEIYAVAYKTSDSTFAVYPRTGWMMWSIGKDLRSNTVGYRSLRTVIANEATTHPALGLDGDPRPAAGFRYDPTNGTTSPGDMYRFEGDAIDK